MFTNSIADRRSWGQPPRLTRRAVGEDRRMIDVETPERLG
jgi:hypothetical protein